VPVFRADLHVHTVLSPCGDMEQSPKAVVKAAKNKGISLLGIADHNASENVKACIEAASRTGGVNIIPGVEITSAEEVHVLGIFRNPADLGAMQGKIYQRLGNEKNVAKKFGYQVIVDHRDNVLGFNDRLLLAATDMDVDTVVRYIREYGGFAIAAHVDRPAFSMTSQLGFVPPAPAFDAIEVSRFADPDDYTDLGYAVIRSSDAHLPGEVGTAYTEFELVEPTYDELIGALRGDGGNRVVGATPTVKTFFLM
jgi:PHP family Zn ribbon phosphoesterase